MSDLVEQYANEKALDALIAAIRNAVEKGGMALDTVMDLLGVPDSMAADVRRALGA